MADAPTPRHLPIDASIGRRLVEAHDSAMFEISRITGDQARFHAFMTVFGLTEDDFARDIREDGTSKAAHVAYRLELGIEAADMTALRAELARVLERDSVGVTPRTAMLLDRLDADPEVMGYLAAVVLKRKDEKLTFDLRGRPPINVSIAGPEGGKEITWTFALAPGLFWSGASRDTLILDMALPDTVIGGMRRRPLEVLVRHPLLDGLDAQIDRMIEFTPGMQLVILTDD